MELELILTELRPFELGLLCKLFIVGYGACVINWQMYCGHNEDVHVGF